MQGVEPRWKGLNTIIPVAMVSKRAYSVLVAASYVGSTISFVEDGGVDVPESDQRYGLSNKKHINSDTWEPLEKLHRGEGWPRSDAYVQKKFEELKALHQDWPDRYIVKRLCAFVQFADDLLLLFGQNDHTGGGLPTAHEGYRFQVKGCEG